MPLFEEQVPNFGKLIYDPATDPVFELTQQLTKEYPEKYHQLKERQTEDLNRMNSSLTGESDWRVVHKLISHHKAEMKAIIQTKDELRNMNQLNKMKNKSLPFYFVDLDPQKVEVFKQIVETANNPHDKKSAQEALDNYKELIRQNKSQAKPSKRAAHNQVLNLNTPGNFRKQTA